MRALVVEDHAGIRAELVRALEERRHQVVACADAETAQQAWALGVFPLVVLDWRLPGMDGLAFCRWLRTQPGGERSVVLVVTGHAEAHDLALMLDAGADDYLAKPFRLDLLQVRLTVAERQVAELAERKELEERLWHLAHHDSLTGLPNRALFMERLEQTLAASPPDRCVAVLFLDLDGFKHVNDSLGHEAGDRLLAQVGRRLAESVRPGDTVARFGGDEFTLLPGLVSDAREAASLAERLLTVLQIPFVLDDFEAFVGASIGVAVNTAAGVDPGSLLRAADTALYRAKAVGRGACVLFESHMQTQAHERLQRDGELRRALDRGELLLHYQPEVNLHTGRVVGVEALVRWAHPRLGLLAPAEFLPLADETGLIVAVDRWVLAEACRQAREWRRDPDTAALTIGVNVAAGQLGRADLVEEVARTLLTTGLDPAALRLEITEHAAVEDLQAATGTLKGLKALGVRLAIDDFGVGFSSLGYVRELAVDTLKLDRSFMGHPGRDGANLAVVQAVTTLAHALGIDVTAEGIEIAEQLASARRAGVDRGQGLFFAAPMPAAEVGVLLGRGLSYQQPSVVVGLAHPRTRNTGNGRLVPRARVIGA